MRRDLGPGLRFGLILALLGCAVTRVVPAAAEPPAVAAADREILGEVLRDHEIITVPHRPGIERYVEDLSTALGAAIAGWLGRALPGFTEGLGNSARVAVWGLFGIVGSLLALLLARWLAARRSRATTDGASSGAAERAGPGASERQLDWRAEIERRLAKGAAREALEALWHWLARRLVDGPVDASWTSRELVLRAGREDLLPAVRRLDHLLYGAAAPGKGDVRRLWNELQQDPPREIG